MKNKTEAELLAICEHLKKTYVATMGTGFFFDLSREFYVVHLLSNSDEIAELVCRFQGLEKPYAMIEYFNEDPLLCVDGVVFYKDENLKTQKITAYRTNIPTFASIKDIQRELRMLSELLKSKAS